MASLLIHPDGSFECYDPREEIAVIERIVAGIDPRLVGPVKRRDEFPLT